MSIYIYIFVIYSANQQIVQRIRNFFFFFSLKREMRKSIAQGGFDPHTYTYARIHTHTHTHTYIYVYARRLLSLPPVKSPVSASSIPLFRPCSLLHSCMIGHELREITHLKGNSDHAPFLER